MGVSVGRDNVVAGHGSVNVIWKEIRWGGTAG